MSASKAAVAAAQQALNCRLVEQIGGQWCLRHAERLTERGCPIAVAVADAVAAVVDAEFDLDPVFARHPTRTVRYRLVEEQP